MEAYSMIATGNGSAAGSIVDTVFRLRLRKLPWPPLHHTPYLVAVMIASAASAQTSRPSRPIVAAKLGTYVGYKDSDGDVWTTTWADDDNLYTVADDTWGWRKACKSNLAVHKLTGNDPARLDGVTINAMTEYGSSAEVGKDGCNWKANGMTCVDGVLYLAVSRHRYGKNAPGRNQTAQNASIIESSDHGATWTRTATENQTKPMFPGRRFGAPFFVEYQKDGKVRDASGRWVLPPHGGAKYVYALSCDGFWENGNNMILGRVRRDRIGRLDAADWQYYKGGDGLADSSWTSEMNQAALVLNDPGHISMCSIQYLSGLNRYVMLQWYWTTKDQVFDLSTTVWEFYESPMPWGPWKKFHSHTYRPEAFYNPCIASKFISDDGRTMTVLAAGDFKKHVYYHLHVIPLTLTVARSDGGQPLCPSPQ
jgi:hypothetical protein